MVFFKSVHMCVCVCVKIVSQAANNSAVTSGRLHIGPGKDEGVRPHLLSVLAFAVNHGAISD